VAAGDGFDGEMEASTIGLSTSTLAKFKISLTPLKVCDERLDGGLSSGVAARRCGSNMTD
jgi:hypothetical protein